MRRKRFWIVALVLTLALALPPGREVAWAATIVVNSTTDVSDGDTSSIANLIAIPGADGVISLREAIEAANNTPGSDTIAFNIPDCGGVCTIQPSSALPTLTDDGTTIDGYTQPEAAEATDVTSATLLIEIDKGGAHTDGIHITSAGNVITGLVINRAVGGACGIRIEGSDATSNTISGNHIGTDASGAVAKRNNYGVCIVTGAQNNTIGGDTPGERNVISASYSMGITIFDSSTAGNIVSGNYIGTDANGTARLGNSERGVNIASAAANTVGGDTAGERNVISGNGFTGVEISSTGATSNVVSGNYIGTDASGTVALGNGIGNGVRIYGNADNNTIGGDTPGERNVISGNDYTGVLIMGYQGWYPNGNIVSGNIIGMDASGTAALGNWQSGVHITNGAHDNTIGPGNIIAHNVGDGVGVHGSTTTGNTITQNSIYANDEMGIELTGGANGSIATPVIATTVGAFNIVGTACADCTVEVFENGDTDGEGESCMGSTTANSSGDFTLSVSSLSKPYLTATATDGVSGTSEFSAVFTVTEWINVYLPIILNNH